MTDRPQLVVITDHVRLRAAPSIEAAIITELPRGERVASTSDYAWRHVTLADGSQGWVAADFLQEIVP